RSGKLVVLSIVTDVRGSVVETGLEDFLKKYGVEMERDYILRIAGRGILPEVPAKTSEKGSDLAQAFAPFDFYVYMARTVRPGRRGSGYRAEPLLEVVPQAGQITWADRTLAGLATLESHVNNLLQTGKLKDLRLTEPLPVGVTVVDKNGSPRMVVYGDGRMA